MSDIKILSQKSIFTSRYFEVEEVEIERNGRTFVKEFCKRRPAVFVLAINEKDEVYLVSQYREVLQKTTVELVAGTCEEGSSPLANAQRELSEEAGVTAKDWKALETIELSANVNQQVHLFLATNLQEGKSHPDDDEEIEVVKLPFEEALQKVLKGEITLAPSVTGILLYDALRREGKV
jgi:ADP-ribose pyrophosphatase